MYLNFIKNILLILPQLYCQQPINKVRGTQKWGKPFQKLEFQLQLPHWPLAVSLWVQHFRG